MSNKCVRCHGINESGRDLCPDCFFGDILAMQFSTNHQELIKAVRAIREYWDMPLADKEAIKCLMSL
jgi:hypothetical protein